jgi:MFS family permease
MSVRYFAIFLYDNLHINPVNVQALYIIAPLIQASLMKIAQILAQRYGRCRMAVAFRWTGIILMFAMVVSYTRGFPVWTTCTILLVRTAFMNATSALTKSVLMDHVPKEERAKWSALESLNMFSWSGSAALGGILVDYRGIVFNFCVTACLQFVATMPFLVLSLFRKTESGDQENEEDNEGAGRPRAGNTTRR